MAFEIINRLKKEKGITNAELAKASGVTLSTIDKITSGINTNPKLDTLQAICRVLGCSLNDFDDPANKKSALSTKAQEIAIKFDALDSYGQKAVNCVLNVEYERCENEKRAEQIESISATLPMWKISDGEMITLPLLLQSRSAGHGDFADDETTDDIQIKLTNTTRQADYLITVDGDSMEPDFPDGCTVAVKLQEKIEVGQIGVFVSCDGSYIKRRGEKCLESINPKYPDIKPDEGTVCRGLVLGVVH